jgi:hypothetical protein
MNKDEDVIEKIAIVPTDIISIISALIFLYFKESN